MMVNISFQQQCSPRFDQNMRRLLSFSIFGAILALAYAQTCIPDTERIDCHPDPGSTQESCEKRGCTWCVAEVDGFNVPWCYIPKTYGYKMDGQPIVTDDGFTVYLNRSTSISLFGGDANRLIMTGEFQSDYRLRIKITDGTDRWEVPLEVYPPTGGNKNRRYEVYFTNTPAFSFKVVRKATGTVLFDTALGGLTFADQFLQISTKLPSKNVYGIGENEQHTFRHSFNKYPNFPLYGRDQPPAGNGNMYGVHPHYTVLEDDGNTHSVAIVNSNAQEFNMLPTPGILYRTIGGVLDLYFFLGPTPENVVEQFTEAVGRSDIPPYFALGFHLCRYNYLTLDKMKAAVDRTARAGIPHDAQWGDIDIMDRCLDFTVSNDRFAGLAEYVQELKSRGVKFVTIQDPCIVFNEPEGTYPPYDSVRNKNIWINRPDGKTPVVGKVWPDAPIYFADYSNPETRQWWIDQIVAFKKVLDFDALWIDMNEPANFVNGDMYEKCAVNKWNNPPYLPKILGNYLPDKTVCGDHVEKAGRHYDTHSLYGWYQSEPTLAGMKLANNNEKRGFILSRSTFLGSGKWAAHWLGDNFSRWNNLRPSIIGILQFNQFGIPFSGVDICGFIFNSNADLCQRWMQLGAFYPFSRNHNGAEWIDQDPAFWGKEVADSSRAALLIRYTLLPYLYTLFYHHHTKGNTVARALWHEYPHDPNTFGIDGQFLWGSGFLISPVLEEGATSLDMYFPDDRYYSYHDGGQAQFRKQWTHIHSGKEFIQLFVRGGRILPTQEPATTTQEARENPLGLIVALDDEFKATGDLYYDSGDSPDPVQNGLYFLGSYTYSDNTLVAKVEKDGFKGMALKILGTIRLMGSSGITGIEVNGESHHDFEKLSSGEVAVTNLHIVANSEFTIKFLTN